MKETSRKRFTLPLAAFAATALLQGCASTPAPRTAAATECTLLAAQMQQAAAETAAAEQKARVAWKAVIPVAVAAQAATGHAEANHAAARLRGLKAESDALGCVQMAQSHSYR